MFSKISSMFSKIRNGFEEMKADGERAGQEQSSERAKNEAKKFTSLGRRTKIIRKFIRTI